MCNFLILVQIILICPFFYAQHEITPDSLNQLLEDFEFNKVVHNIKHIERTRDLTAEEMIITAKAYQGTFNYSQAVHYLNNAYDKSGYSLTINSMMAFVLKELHRTREAEEYLREIIENDPNNNFAILGLTEILMSQSRFNEALAFLKTLMETDSINTHLLNKVAYINLKLGDIKNATKFYKKVLRLEPNNNKAILNLGKILLDADSLIAAKDLLARGVTIYPDNRTMEKLLAESYFRMEDFEEAVIHFGKATCNGDSTVSLFQKLGFSYYFIANSNAVQSEGVYLLKIQEALNSFQIAFIKEDTNPVSAYYIGICNKELKKYDEAIEYFNKAVELIFPDYLTDLLTNFGAAEEYRGNLGEAITLYNQAYKFNTQKKYLLFYIASAMDRYYADRATPIIYYNKFLEEDKSENQILLRYAKDRIESLNTELHFRVGEKNLNR